MEPIELLIFILPTYVANAAPVVLRGKTPIDMGQKMKDKNRIFGENKTIKGFLFAIAAGTIVSALTALLLPQVFSQLSFNEKIALGFLLSLGAMLGDLIGSFVKRRIGMQSGQESPIMDKILFAITALIVAYPIYNGKIALGILDATIILILTYFLHIVFNRIAHAAKLKKVPW